jgi:hypothetical protein
MYRLDDAMSSCLDDAMSSCLDDAMYHLDDAMYHLDDAMYHLDDAMYRVATCEPPTTLSGLLNFRFLDIGVLGPQ